ncbi:MAG: tryptophan synthase subunit alpha, partial [Acidaminococcaceae bacterium]
MNKLANSLQQGKACVPFLTCGDPDLATTAALIKSLSQGGADLLILGLPFSDPTAETPSIQSASLRSLANGTTTDTFFTFLRHLRAELTIPLVVMTYANVVFSYGCDRFLATCAELGLAGLLLPDVPWEEKAEFASVCAKYDLVLISTLAPASDTRMAKIAQEAQGFLYLEPALEVS